MKYASCLFFVVFVLAAAAPAFALEENRTANRAPTGEVFYPKFLTTYPEHYPFLPYTSNHDAQNDHPQQWQGQDWDPSMWNEKWTPEAAIRKFYQARIFHRQYVRNKKVAVLELGPTFFKLSDLDQRRCLKLLVDTSDLFNLGYDMVDLRDWYTKRPVGSYTRKGMQLN